MQKLKNDFAKTGKETKPIEFLDERLAVCGNGSAPHRSYKDSNNVWSIDSLRLNPHANQLFDMAKDYIKTGKISKNNQDIAKIIEKDLINANKDDTRSIIEDIMETY